MAKTTSYDPKRLLGGTIELVRDPKTGAYSTKTVGVAANVASSSVATSASWKELNYDQTYSASCAGEAENQVKKVTVDVADSDATGIADADLKAVRSFVLGGHGGTLLPEFTTVSGTTVSFFYTGSHAAADACTLSYSKAPSADTGRGDFEDRTGDATSDTLAIPEVDLQLNSSAIVAKTRKLKAVWSPELAQDLNAYHSVDAEAELTSMLSEYISMEIDLEILDMLIQDATTVDYWSAKAGTDYDGTSEFVKDTQFFGTRFEWWQTLVGKIQKVSNEIHKLTLRGGANFVVCGPKIATILESSIPGYAASTDGNKAQFAMGVSQVGSVAGRFQVYKNPYMTENAILVGFRGSNFLETGAVYAPYVPLIMTPLVYDPSDFTPRKGVMTRYAKKMIRPEFYGKIYCSDLNIV